MPMRRGLHVSIALLPLALAAGFRLNGIEPPPPRDSAAQAASGAAPSPTAEPKLPPTATHPAPTAPGEPTPTLPSGSDFDCLPPGGTRDSAVVAGVIDGDTITVLLRGLTFTVRYIGIDTPETNIQPPEPWGPEATARNREFVSGERALLVGDPEVGNTDRYNRLLRYVIVGDLFVNAALVREGLGRYYPGGNACGALIFAAENAARAAGAGMWGPGAIATP